MVRLIKWLFWRVINRKQIAAAKARNYWEAS